jgi:hypothetical protein
MENSILEVITMHFPVSFDDVKEIYTNVKSFDTTIKIIQHAISIGYNPYAYYLIVREAERKI